MDYENNDEYNDGFKRVIAGKFLEYYSYNPRKVLEMAEEMTEEYGDFHDNLNFLERVVRSQELVQSFDDQLQRSRIPKPNMMQPNINKFFEDASIQKEMSMEVTEEDGIKKLYYFLYPIFDPQYIRSAYLDFMRNEMEKLDDRQSKLLIKAVEVVLEYYQFKHREHRAYIMRDLLNLKEYWNREGKHVEDYFKEINCLVIPYLLARTIRNITELKEKICAKKFMPKVDISSDAIREYYLSAHRMERPMRLYYPLFIKKFFYGYMLQPEKNPHLYTTDENYTWDEIQAQACRYLRQQGDADDNRIDQAMTNGGECTEKDSELERPNDNEHYQINRRYQAFLASARERL